MAIVWKVRRGPPATVAIRVGPQAIDGARVRRVQRDQRWRCAQRYRPFEAKPVSAFRGLHLIQTATPRKSLAGLHAIGGKRRYSSLTEFAGELRVAMRTIFPRRNRGGCACLAVTFDMNASNRVARVVLSRHFGPAKKNCDDRSRKPSTTDQPSQIQDSKSAAIRTVRRVRRSRQIHFSRTRFVEEENWITNYARRKISAHVP
jgi:hypothetical protein